MCVSAGWRLFGRKLWPKFSKKSDRNIHQNKNTYFEVFFLSISVNHTANRIKVYKKNKNNLNDTPTIKETLKYRELKLLLFLMRYHIR